MQRGWGLTLILVLLANSAVVPRGWAAEGDEAPIVDPGNVCKMALEVEGEIAAIGPECAAADAWKKSRKAQELLLGVFGVTAGVCTVSCVYPAYSAACIGLGLLSIASDITISTRMRQQLKDISMAMYALNIANVLTGGAIASAAWSGITSALSSVGISAGASSSSSSSSNMNTCVTAVFFYAKLGIAIAGTHKARKATHEHEDRARELLTTYRSPTSVTGSGTPGPSRLSALGGADNPDGPGRFGGGADTLGALPPSALPPGCDEVQNDGAAASCARAIDSSVPRGFSDPNIQRLVKDLTGSNLKDLGAKIANSGMTAAQVAGNMLAQGDKAKAKEISDLLQPVADQAYAAMLGSSTKVAMYTPSGGAGAKGAGGKGVGDIFGGGAASRSPAVAAPVDELNLRMQASAEEISQDRSISLFSRVEYRHRKLKERLANLPFASIYNRATVNGMDLR